MSEPIIRVENLGKKYSIRHEHPERYTALRDVLSQKARKLFSFPKHLRPNPPVSDYEDFWAIKDLNFEIQQGDRVGIIGRNGAGKSTLLKILSRITEPTIGRIELNGRVASLLEVGTGFHPELTGRENIFLNGAILGMGRTETKNKFDEIVDFSGVERFLDTPVKRYSSGMYVRLAFAVAAHLDPEILVVDEVLAVGDAEFQNKCLSKIEQTSKQEGRTVLFVSHNIGIIADLCNYGIYLKNGMHAEIGEVSSIIKSYKSEINQFKKGYESTVAKGSSAHFLNIYITGENDVEKYEFNHDESITINIKLLINSNYNNETIFITILDHNKLPICSSESNSINSNMKVLIPKHFLTRGIYSLHIFIHKPQQYRSDEAFDICHFRIDDNGSKFAKHGDYNYGCIFGNFTWH